MWQLAEKGYYFLSSQYLKHFHVTNRSSFNFSGTEMKFLALFSKCFLSHENEKSATLSTSFGLKTVSKTSILDRLVWTVGLTVEIKSLCHSVDSALGLVTLKMHQMFSVHTTVKLPQSKVKSVTLRKSLILDWKKKLNTKWLLGSL